MDLKKRLLALVLAVLLILPGGVLLSPALPAAASSSGLYGSGSADEINIIRLLDMALNKGGMSMSPSTIQAFLDFWWSSVQSDLQVLLQDADASISTASALVDHIAAAASDPANADGLEMAQLVVKFARFCVTMEFKTLDDFKQLLTQQGTFRRFLLSYVTDEQGNIAGTVDNKLAKYKLKSGFISMVRQAADLYIDEYEGYYLFKTHKPSDLMPSDFSNKLLYDTVTGLLKNMSDDQVVCVGYYGYYGPQYSFYDISDYGVIWNSDTASTISVSLLSDDWSRSSAPVASFSYANGQISGLDFDLSDLTVSASFRFSSISTISLDKPFGNNFTIVSVYTKDGRSIKIWKTQDAYKNNIAGKSNIYYSKDYAAFDESKDKGLTFTGSYYSGDYSHDTIQNTIDNSQTSVDNSVVNNIVNNYITNNYGDGSGSSGGSSSGDGSGSGSGSGNDWWNIGDGIAAVIKGVAQLLDFALKLLGDLIGVISEFLVGLLEVLKRLGDVGASFGSFLKDFFGFLPEEIIDLLVVGIGAVVVAGVIKGFKK